MSERPSVPAELRRRVLVEAGHRCAIHTCRHPEVDIHHIIPWEQCQEHSYDNLIALCPNCHRRANNEEIDRKSLRMYKAQLAASFGISAHQPAARQFSGDFKTKNQTKWKTFKIEEGYKFYLPYEVELEIPHFEDDEDEIAQLNLLQYAYGLSQLLDFRLLRLTTEKIVEDWEKSPSSISNLTVSFEISCYTDAIISIRYSFFHYGAWAAHPNHYTEVANYQLKPLIKLRLNDLFMPDESFLVALSAYSIKELSRQKGESEPSHWITEGAGPKIDNFRKFNLTNDGLLITFDEYQVGCYAEGGYTVFVPKEILQGYVRPTCRIGELWMK